jgi:hypothetical protein
MLNLTGYGTSKVFLENEAVGNDVTYKPGAVDHQDAQHLHSH